MVYMMMSMACSLNTCAAQGANPEVWGGYGEGFAIFRLEGPETEEERHSLLKCVMSVTYAPKYLAPP